MWYSFYPSIAARISPDAYDMEYADWDVFVEFVESLVDAHNFNKLYALSFGLDFLNEKFEYFLGFPLGDLMAKVSYVENAINILWDEVTV